MTLSTIDIAHFLGPEGPIARRLSGYEPRPQQIAMAEAVDRALRDQGRLMVEAGTGVGKSFAYLLPAIRAIVEEKKRVIVATHTISLQEQLVEKDIPLLNAVIPEEFTSVLVKGRGNYISLRRLKLASDRETRLFSDEESRHTLHQIIDWTYSTRDGTLSTLPQLKRMDVWDYVQSDAHNCMGKKCPLNDKCFYQAARRRMENGDLLICNHALFFADLALRMHGASMLPNYDHVIFDEAHNIEDVAAEHFGLSLSESRVQHLLGLMYRSRNATGFLTSLKLKDASNNLIEKTIEQVMMCANAADRFFEDLQRLHERSGGQDGRIAGPDPIPDSLSAPMKRLAEALALLKRRAASEPDAFELNSYAERAAAIAQEAEMLIGQKIDDCVYWTELQESRRYRRVRPRMTIRCAPIEVGPVLREQMFERKIGIVMTSATLATAKGDFRHAAARLGCDDPATLQLGSPFDYARQVRFIVDRSMPDPNASDFAAALPPRILEHIRATDGGAFVLFTSFALLNSVADELGPELRDMGYSVLVQGKDGPRGVLLESFRENDRSVLFGTATFWQGVDVRGRALRNVIITRLPFDVPDRPLIKARLERIAERGGNPFMDDSVPRAIIRFKQGFGRLIRSASDTGRVVVLDPRTVTKPYGRLFLSALPEGVEPIDAAAIEPV